MAVTTGMVGQGFYNRNSAPQHAAIRHVLPWLEQALQDLPLGDGPVAATLADFGCSEGANSIAVMRQLLPVLRQRTDRPLATVHSDLPTNDFGELFRALRGENGPVLGEDVYSCAVGGSMYDRLLPPGSLGLATTFNAIGYFGRRPLERLEDYIVPNGPMPGRTAAKVTPAEHAACAGQAAADLEAYLLRRAVELVPGGLALVQVFGVGPMGRTCDGIYDALDDSLRELVAAGRIDRDNYARFYQPVYFRDLDELTAPVAGPNAPLAHLFALERAECYEVPVPFVEAWRAGGDTAGYAAACTAFFRAFTEPVLRLAFAADPDPDGLVQAAFAGAERLIAAKPETYLFRYVSVAALLRRRGARLDD
ncbi:class I SAM-dependent methyltransferase [Geminicoccus roseus]|uniref:hypothetical protein n=1 Tax=Geminicoccus roseus TaxID=404900 RepID=UPI00041D98DD|nr:hypothetical protein [Geminicoccus roseus]